MMYDNQTDCTMYIQYWLPMSVFFLGVLDVMGRWNWVYVEDVMGRWNWVYVEDVMGRWNWVY